jgi:catechol 2,3-dioxygenase-like lactoylglutathione lyase family enzyme
MFSHVMVGATDIARAKRFYDSVLGVLGVGPAIEDRDSKGFRRLFYVHSAGIFGVSEPIDGGPATVANGGTIGFRCHNLDQVVAFHDAAVAAGGTSIEDSPGRRDGNLGGPMHLAYVRDLDGNKLCALHSIKELGR